MMFPALVLSNFSMTRPRHEVSQLRMLEWLADAHAEAEAGLAPTTPGMRADFAARIDKLIRRCACGPAQISKRGFSIPDIGSSRWSENTIYDIARHPHGAGTAARSRRYAEVVDAYFEAEYAAESVPPRDVVHVTCTGYVSPSPAQKLLSKRGWGAKARVTHAYHMGCYASLPALRIAAGCLATAGTPGEADVAQRVDIVHTELCSLHLDPTLHDIEQLVVQSLFADGFIRYSLSADGGASHSPGGPELRLLGTHDALLPESTESMTWVFSDWGMQMTLARDVPDRIATALRGFVTELYRRAGRDIASAKSTVFAVHPGGPKIIDAVGTVLELEDGQLRASREVLREHGNMSSATLPHIWKQVVEDPAVAPGTLVASLAFGPGLTCCGGLFEKR